MCRSKKIGYSDITQNRLYMHTKLQAKLFDKGFVSADVKHAVGEGKCGCTYALLVHVHLRVVAAAVCVDAAGSPLAPPALVAAP